MATETIELAAVPVYEDCLPAGHKLAWQQAQIFKRQLERQFPAPSGAYYSIKSNPHDFGTYYEVCIKVDETDAPAFDWAWDMQNNLPEHWDDTAERENLALLEQVPA